MLSEEETKEFYKMMRKVGLNLRKVRKDRKKTQVAMSDQIGISLKYYQALENGDRALSMRSIFRISKRIEVTLDRLIL